MFTAEFIAKAKNNIIEIPEKFRGLYSKNLKVKIEIEVPKISSKGIEKLYGALHKGANPKLKKEEKFAWHKAIADKYGNS